MHRPLRSVLPFLASLLLPGATAGQTPAVRQTPPARAAAGRPTSRPTPRVTPVPGTAGTRSESGKSHLRPMSPADCAGEKWRSYPALQFRRREHCEVWVRRHSGRPIVVRAPGAPAPTAVAADSKSKVAPTPRKGKQSSPTRTPARKS